MSRFSDEMSIIPTPARVIAVLAYVALAVAFVSISIFTHDPGLTHIPMPALVAIFVFAPLPLAIWVLLIGYVNADAKRRGMRYVMWTLLAIFIPNAIGIILYFILRDPRLAPCPRCAHLARPGFAFCPFCGENMAPACPNCKRAVEPGWRNCPACGTVLTGETVGGGTAGGGAVGGGVPPVPPVPPIAGPQTA